MKQPNHDHATSPNRALESAALHSRFGAFPVAELRRGAYGCRGSAFGLGITTSCMIARQTKLWWVLVAFTMCSFAHAELPYKLPPKAKYTASNEAITKAKVELSANLVSDAATLTNLFASPMMCGPGLWNALKGSPHFSKPPVAKSTAKIPIGKGKFQEVPMALLQSEGEVASFRKALADLLGSQGKLTIREPNQDEFMKYWATIPFNEITGPLVIGEGKDVSIFCQFEKGRVFWVDEVKQTHFKK